MKREEATKKILEIIEDEKNFSQEFKKLIFECDINAQEQSSWNGLTPIMYLLKWNHQKEISIPKEKIIPLLNQVDTSIQDYWGYNIFYYLILNKKNTNIENSIIKKLWKESYQKAKEKTFLKAIENFESTEEEIKTSSLTMILYMIKDLDFHLNKKIEKKIKNKEIITIIQNYDLYQLMERDLIKKISNDKKNKI